MDEANTNKLLVYIYYFYRLSFKDWEHKKSQKLENWEGKLFMSLLSLQKFLKF